jgi:hypothetical protein
VPPFSPSPLQVAIVTASAMLAAAIGLLATLRRGHWLTTLLFASAFLSLAAFQAGTLGILHSSGSQTARLWASYLAGVSALASWLWLGLSVVLARPNPPQQIRNAGAYLALALVGCVTLSAVANTPHVVRDVEGLGGSAVIRLGAMGKVYLMYLVVVMVAVLMNLESMLRIAPASSQRRLRPMFVAFVVGILANLLVVSAALLYGGLQITWIAASSVPMFLAGVVTAFALARQRLSDMAVPVARPVIYYSSVSLTLAGAFLLTMAALSKVLPVLTPEWKRTVSLLFYLLVGGGGLLLTFSPRANRAVKRFIDRNFYANRYDYRREWERVSRAITPTARVEDICRQIEALMRSLFESERVVVHLKDERSGAFVRVFPPASVRWSEVEPILSADSLMVKALDRLRTPLVFPRPVPGPRHDPDRGREPWADPGDVGRGERAAPCRRYDGRIAVARREAHGRRVFVRGRRVPRRDVAAARGRALVCQARGPARGDPPARIVESPLDIRACTTSRTRCRGSRWWSKTRAGISLNRSSSATLCAWWSVRSRTCGS